MPLGAFGFGAPDVAVFTQVQVEAGRAEYEARCAVCHGADLSGSHDVPPLAGPDFLATWGSQTTLDLFRYALTMPPGGRGLKEEQYLSVVAFVLHRNGAASGETPLGPSTAVRVDRLVSRGAEADRGR